MDAAARLHWHLLDDLSVQWAMFCSAFAIAFMYLWINLRQTAKNSGVFHGDGRARKFTFSSPVGAGTRTSIELPPGLLNLAVILISGGIALFVASGFNSEWDTYLRFRYGGLFGLSDPLFGVDVGFYVFHLPFYILLQSSLVALTVLTLADCPWNLRVLWIKAGKR